MFKGINTCLKYIVRYIIVELIIVFCLIDNKIERADIILMIIGLYFGIKIICVLVDLKLGPKTENLKYKKVRYVFNWKNELWDLLDSRSRIWERIPIEQYDDETMINGQIEFEKGGKDKQIICLKIMCKAKEVKNLSKGKQISEISYYRLSHIIKI